MRRKNAFDLPFYAFSGVSLVDTDISLNSGQCQSTSDTSSSDGYSVTKSRYPRVGNENFWKGKVDHTRMGVCVLFRVW